MINPLQPLLDRVRTDVSAVKTANGVQAWTKEPLTPARIAAHLGGGPARGVCPIQEGEATVRAAVLDLDSHKGEVSWLDMCAAAIAITAQLNVYGLIPTPFASSGGAGIHLILLWDEPQDAYSVRQLLAECLKAAGYSSGTRGIARREVEIFPKQNYVRPGGYGNQFVLPLAGKSVPLDPTAGLAKLDRDTPFTWFISDPVVRRLPPERKPLTSAPVAGLATIQEALEVIPNEGEEEQDYDSWRNILFGIHHATNGSADGLALAHQFSSRSSKYDPTFLDERVWPYIKSTPDGVTERTILAMAQAIKNQPSANDFEPLKDDFRSNALVPIGYQFLQAAQFAKAKALPWIVRDLLPQAELGVIYGAPGSGKTFWALDVLLTIARGGTTWRDRRALPGRVAYVAAEGAGGVRTRLQAYANHASVSLDALDFFALGDAPNLLDAKATAAMLDALATLAPLSLLVLDTYASVMPGGNENSGEDAGLVIAACKRFHRKTGALVLLIHHCGKDSAKGARGWSGMLGAVDVEINVTRDAKNGNRCASVTKLKDGRDTAQDFGFRLDVVRLPTMGEDEVKSCVVIHEDFDQSDMRSEPVDTEPYDAFIQALGGAIRAPEAHIITAMRTILECSMAKADSHINKLVRRNFIVRDADGCLGLPPSDISDEPGSDDAGTLGGTQLPGQPVQG